MLHNVGPLNQLDATRLHAAAARWTPRLADLPRPYTVLLVGGDSSSYALDAVTAARLGREASARVRASGGTLLLTTSARTPAAAAEALLAAVDCRAHVYRWRADDSDNPYFAFLALADRFIVTADSASLVTEACATGRPVELFDWPVRADARRGVKGWLRRWGEARDRDGSRPTAKLYDGLVYIGLIKPARDFGAFHRALEARGLVGRCGESAGAAPRVPLDDMARALERIRRLLADLDAVVEKRGGLRFGEVAGGGAVRDRAVTLPQ